MRQEFLIRSVVALFEDRLRRVLDDQRTRLTCVAFSNAFLTNCRIIVRLYPPLMNPAASEGPARGVSIPDSLPSGVARIASFSLNLVASLVLFVRRGGSEGGVPKEVASSSPRVRLRPTREVVRSVGIGTADDIALLASRPDFR